MGSEGFLKLGGYKVFYRSKGEPTKGTLLGLHGGPGLSHDYLSPLFDLSKFGYRVVFYDQSGGGRSEVPKNPADFTIERYVVEAEGVRRALRLGRVHLYGFSWGGMLAQAYALKYQHNLSSLILSGTTPSLPLLQSEVERLVRALPTDIRHKIQKYESAGDFETPDTSTRSTPSTGLHECRLDVRPEALKYSFEHMGKEVGRTVFGPNLTQVSGNMRYWDVTKRLGELHLPCLIVCGEHDFLTPKLHRIMHREIRGSGLVLLKSASHISMWEARDAYLNSIRGFLDGLARN